MIELNLNEMEVVTGGIVSGTLRQPIANATSEWGRMVNDGAAMVNDFGHWLGGSIYDWTH
ncbi:hypothetical protein HUX88_24060 [Duganella sp. BJB1802]|uniref:hypothetical protein n=1 Tax=Duganella sp. BJB1802 TaxID=2744575 RepID=UPI0015934F85|nr:hypothetical protein [Duganella sp. BJB1802]NVD73589.1 hypothetical protein [Duganella sp. BJB1802]